MPEPKYSEEEILSQLRAYCEEAGTQVEAAKQLDISNAYLSDILNKKRGISAEIANKLGFVKTTVFYYKEGEA
jgi:plasmid maintenance system antidote protein VapI